MKIAITGKGGTGKTTIAGALARHLARRGHEVVAVDGDPNPNLGISLGVPPERVETMSPILNALLASGYTHHDPKPHPDELIRRYGIEAPDGVMLVATGKIERPTDACLCCGSHMTTREFFGELPAEDRMVVADLEAAQRPHLGPARSRGRGAGRSGAQHEGDRDRPAGLRDSGAPGGAFHSRGGQSVRPGRRP